MGAPFLAQDLEARKQKEVCNCSQVAYCRYITQCGFNWLITSTKKEYNEKYGWWIKELESLGIAANKTNEFNNIKEVSSLANNIKQVLFQDYKTLYNTRSRLRSSSLYPLYQPRYRN